MSIQTLISLTYQEIYFPVKHLEEGDGFNKKGKLINNKDKTLFLFLLLEKSYGMIEIILPFSQFSFFCKQFIYGLSYTVSFT